jgi:glycosyltransferase involved in cell wall biosynthesis
MRILHASTNIANQAWAIAQGLREIGHEAEVWHFGENSFDFPCDRNPPWPPENLKDLWNLMDEALERFDAFHFHFGRSLVPGPYKGLPALWDLPYYRAAQKPVFFTFHGSDARLKSVHLEQNEWSYYRFADVTCEETAITKRLQIIRTYANATFICSPVNEPYVPDARFHPRAIELREWDFVGPTNTHVPLIVHAPSRRATKGSEFVERGIENLRNKGLRFEFRLIENLPHAEVRKVLQQADIVVDNLLLGDYEVTGLEAMALGKVLIARLDDVVEERMGKTPILNANPKTFEKVLAGAIKDADLRARLGTEGRAFVEANHDVAVVARELAKVYENPPSTPPLTWPDWAALGGARREERLEQAIQDLQVRVKSRIPKPKPPTFRAKPFTVIGARLDRVLNAVRRRARRLMGRT